MGQILAPSSSSHLPDMFKERSFCSPEDTQNAAAIGRLVNICLSCGQVPAACQLLCDIEGL